MAQKRWFKHTEYLLRPSTETHVDALDLFQGLFSADTSADNHLSVVVGGNKITGNQTHFFETEKKNSQHVCSRAARSGRG